MMSQMGTDGEDVPARPANAPYRVLFVCTGNICRSPMAEVAFRGISERTALADGGTLADVVEVDSAGTANWHEGSPMDPRARTALDAQGFHGPGSLAAQVTRARLDGTDLAIALDRGHLADLRALASTRTRTALLLEWGDAPDHLEVADPFYGTDGTFDDCLAEIVAACEALAGDLAARATAR